MKNFFITLFETETATIVALACIVIAAAMFSNCDFQIATAKAADKWPQWSPETELDLGKCLRAEADTFKRDWPLLSWCLVKQWRRQPYGRTFQGQVRAHCAVFDPGGRRYYESRPKAIRASTWEKPLHGKLDEWSELRRFVERFRARDVADPCPRCVWWAGHTDTKKPNWTCPVGPVNDRGNSFCYVQR